VEPRCGSSSARSQVVACSAAVEPIRPLVGGKPLSMVLTIQMFMLMAGALIIIFTQTNPMSIAKNEVFRAGMIAVVAVSASPGCRHGVRGEPAGIKSALAGVVQTQPWTYAIALLIVSKLVNSQAARSPPWCRWRCRSACRRGTWSLRGRLLRLLHPADVPLRPRDDPVRPFGHDAHRQVRDQPQLHPARPHRGVQLLPYSDTFWRPRGTGLS